MCLLCGWLRVSVVCDCSLLLFVVLVSGLAVWIGCLLIGLCCLMIAT